MSFQIIVISVSPDRKKALMEQVKELELEKHASVHFINPATLQNTSTYFENTQFDDYFKRTICCARSHLFALEFACLESSPEFSIILEDDVAFHKTQFINSIKECIRRWGEIMKNNRILSLGWVPIAKDREWYECIKGDRLNCFHGSNIRHVLISGFQAYMIRKSDFKQYIPILVTRTYLQYKHNVTEFQKQTNKPEINPIIIDGTLNMLFGQMIVYPPLCIERVSVSDLGHDNWHKYWKPFFAPRKEHLYDYLTFDEHLIDTIFQE